MISICTQLLARTSHAETHLVVELHRFSHRKKNAWQTKPDTEFKWWVVSEHLEMYFICTLLLVEGIFPENLQSSVFR